jgi:hypothetical protein
MAGCDRVNLDFVALAEAFGIPAVRVGGADPLGVALADAVAAPGPVLLEAPIGPPVRAIPVAPPRLLSTIDLCRCISNPVVWIDQQAKLARTKQSPRYGKHCGVNRFTPPQQWIHHDCVHCGQPGSGTGSLSVWWGTIPLAASPA